jgi:hypothetical protein
LNCKDFLAKWRREWREFARFGFGLILQRVSKTRKMASFPNFSPRLIRLVPNAKEQRNRLISSRLTPQFRGRAFSNLRLSKYGALFFATFSVRRIESGTGSTRDPGCFGGIDAGFAAAKASRKTRFLQGLFP